MTVINVSAVINVIGVLVTTSDTGGIVSSATSRYIVVGATILGWQLHK